jgi:hypothetical protein
MKDVRSRGNLKDCGSLLAFECRIESCIDCVYLTVGATSTASFGVSKHIKFHGRLLPLVRWSFHNFSPLSRLSFVALNKNEELNERLKDGGEGLL